MPVSAGHASRITYLWEDDASGNHNFAGTPDDSTAKTFGYNATLQTFERANNGTDQFDPNSAEASERVGTNYSGSLSVSFTLCNPWFWRAVLTKASSTGTSPTTHDFDGQPPWSMQLAIGNEDRAGEVTVKGFIVQTCTLDIPENGEVTVTLSGVFADDSDADSISTSQVTESYDPIPFSDSTLTTESNTYDVVQSTTVTINTNAELVYEMGSRVAVDYRYGPVTTTVDFSKIVENDTILNQTYGGSSPTSPASRIDGDDEFTGSLVLDTGKSGSDQNKQSLLFTGSFPDSYSRTGTGDPTTNLIEEQSLTVRDLDVEAVNADASAS